MLRKVDRTNEMVKYQFIFIPVECTLAELWPLENVPLFKKGVWSPEKHFVSSKLLALHHFFYYYSKGTL